MVCAKAMGVTEVCDRIGVSCVLAGSALCCGLGVLGVEGVSSSRFSRTRTRPRG